MYLNKVTWKEQRERVHQDCENNFNHMKPKHPNIRTTNILISNIQQTKSTIRNSEFR